MSTFCYDLNRELCSFDFYGWLVQAVARGATEITFDLARGTLTPYGYKKFESIIAPGPALAGLPSRVGTDGDKMEMGSSRMGALVRFCAHRSIPRLAVPRLVDYVPHRYTVTLRQQAEATYRNSDEKAWRTFAEEIGAIVIEDYDVKPIHLHDRMALYEGADLNLGIWCGPLTLCTLTKYPVLALGAGRGNEGPQMMKYGVRYGERMPWCLPNQMVLWGDDDLATIRRAFAFYQREANIGAV